MSRMRALVNQRCPVCLQGPVFSGFLRTRTHCPVCDIRFQRESGYYLNAMFVAYVLGFLLLAPLALVLYFNAVSPLLFTLIIVSVITLLWPLVFRYSRVIWLHADQLMEPRQAPAAKDASSPDA
ncbi:MAG: DUF983 domain-containing protein [Caldilineaceae bacterium]|nr:DUF983 domain-containing protein [Caldilineaceae bacterium]MCB9140045.1 DUF983 domain-containing protein [Caldilineaceae bacterium]